MSSKPHTIRHLSKQEKMERVEKLYQSTIASFAESSDKTVETLTEEEREYYRNQIEGFFGLPLKFVRSSRRDPLTAMSDDESSLRILQAPP